MEINNIIQRCIAIIDKEIELIEVKQEEGLDRLDCEKLVDYVKTLIVIEKERRSEKEEAVEFKSDKELEEAILQEAEKIKQNRKASK